MLAERQAKKEKSGKLRLSCVTLNLNVGNLYYPATACLNQGPDFFLINSLNLIVYPDAFTFCEV